MTHTRTPAYRFTIQNLNDGVLASLKKNVKITNQYRRIEEISTDKKLPRQQVVVRARLGKDNPHAFRYRKGGNLKRFSSQTIRPEHGQYFDVYVHEVIRYA